MRSAFTRTLTRPRGRGSPRPSGGGRDYPICQRWAHPRHGRRGWEWNSIENAQGAEGVSGFVRTRWADYGGMTASQLWSLVIGLDIAIVIAGVVALAFGSFLPAGQRQIEGWSLVVGGPILLTWLILRSDAEWPVRLGISAEGLVAVFRRKTFKIPWYQLHAPELGSSKGGYFFRFVWTDSEGKRRPLAVDHATARYIIDQPSCPKWELPRKLVEHLREKKDATFESVKVSFEG